MTTNAVVGVDCSTTACKVLIWDSQGRCLAEGRSGFELLNPEPGAWLQDAEEWWRAFCRASAQAMAACPAGLVIDSLGLTHQRETFVLCDKAGQALAPAMVWMDHRCREDVDATVARLGKEQLHRISGKPAHTTPSLYKLMFQLRRQPSLRKRLAKVLDVGAFLLWRLSGRCATALASADPLGLVDMQKRGWSSVLLDAVGLQERQMAELVPSGCIVGHTTKDAAAATGLPVGLPLVAVGGDGQAAGVGAGIVAPGRAYLNLGTAIVSGVLRQDYLYDQAFRTLFDASGRGYFLETDLHGGTFTLNWLRSTLLGDERGDLTRLEHESRSLAPGADGLLMLPYQGGVMNPYWDASASASFMGLRAHHRPCHFYRAIIEGIALEQRLQSTAVANVAGAIEEFVVLGGGSSSDLWCQVLADVLQKPVVRAASREATALGAAVVAMARGSDCSERAVAMTALAERFEPGPHATYYDALYREVYQGWYPSLRERMGRLDALSKGAR